jgi:hypothetical protein
MHSEGLSINDDQLRLLVPLCRDAQTSQTSESHVKILGTRRVTRRKFHTGDPLILGAMVQNLVAWANWCSRFVNTCRGVKYVNINILHKFIGLLPVHNCEGGGKPHLRQLYIYFPQYYPYKHNIRHAHALTLRDSVKKVLYKLRYGLT